MGNYKLKELKAIWRYVGDKEVDLQEYDYGMVSPNFCFLWKDGKLPNKKMVKIMIDSFTDAEELQKEIKDKDASSTESVKENKTK